MWDVSNITSSFPDTDRLYNFFLSLYAVPQIRKISTAISICCIGYYFYKKLRRNDAHEKFARSLPGPWALPIIGNSFLFIFYRKADAITSLFSRYVVRYGSKFRLWIGKHLLVVLTDVHDIRAVLMSNKNSEKPEIMSSFREFFGANIAFAPVDVWSKSRKVMQPYFTDKQRYKIITQLINQYIDDLEKHVDGPQINLAESLKSLFFSIITKIFFDVKLTDMEIKSLQFEDQVAIGSEISMTRIFRPWLHSKFISDIFYGRKWHTAQTKLFNFVRDKIMTIDARKIEDLKNPEVTPESFPFRYLATLIQDDKDQGRDDLAFSNALVTIAAGNDTTSATTVFFLLTMAMFPEIQDKLYEEIYDLCGDDREPEISDIQKLPYLDQVLKEIQRRFTTLPIIFRKITEDAKINNVIYPAGTALLLSLANVHLDPALYPNPYQFNPDNFSPENVANRPKGSFVPFSAGPRNCIGMQIALVVMKQFIVSSLRSFSFHTTLKMEDIDLRVGFVSHNKSGCPVSLCKRKKNPLL